MTAFKDIFIISAVCFDGNTMIYVEQIYESSKMLDEACSRELNFQSEAGDTLLMIVALACSLHGSSLRLAFGELGPMQEILHCSRVKPDKYK